MRIQAAVYAATCNSMSHCDTVQQVHVGRMNGRVGFSRTIGREILGVVSTLGDNVSDVEIGQTVSSTHSHLVIFSHGQSEFDGLDEHINHIFSDIRSLGETQQPIEVLTNNPQAIKSMG